MHIQRQSLSSEDNLLDADSIVNIANDILVNIGYTHHTVRKLKKMVVCGKFSRG